MQYKGFYKDTNCIGMVFPDESHSRATYETKVLNEFKIGWFDPIVEAKYGGKDQMVCSGRDTVKTPAGTFNCISYSQLGANYYLSKGFGYVGAKADNDADLSMYLVSYTVK